MSTEDDLSAFFAEVNQAEVIATQSNQSASFPDILPPAPSLEVPQPTVVIVSKPSILTKPAEKAQFSSHPVYEYPLPSSDSTEIFEASYNSNPFEFSDGPSFNYTSVEHQDHQSTLSSSLSFPGSESSVSSSSTAPMVIPRQDKKFVRYGGGDVWVDDTLKDWPENDYRLFVGDLAKEVTSEMLTRQFQGFKSFAKAKVVRSKVLSRGRMFGFVSFLDPMDCARAIREMNGKYLGGRPMHLSKSSWKERDLNQVKSKEKKKRKLQEEFGLL